MSLKKKEKLTAYWDKKENCIGAYHPLGFMTQTDAHYLFDNVFTKEFVKEMTDRGYDVTTMKFEISPKLPNYERFNGLSEKYYGKENSRMNYKKVLTRYIQGRLSELSDVDTYEPNKLALANMLWFLGKVTSNEMIVAKLRIMVDADIKRKKYLSRYDGNESLYDDEYSKAVSTIGKKCLSYLRNAKKEVQDENKASQEDLEKPE